MPKPDERTVMIDAAFALLMAAITMRDLVSAMPPAVYKAMPDGLRGRMARPDYEQAFEQFPPDIRAVARALVEADPDIIVPRIS
jgi:hypothetical protein